MEKREYIGIVFTCCNVYARIYLNRERTAFVGRCPRCYRKKAVVEVVQHGGSEVRFFEVD